MNWNQQNIIKLAFVLFFTILMAEEKMVPIDTSGNSVEWNGELWVAVGEGTNTITVRGRSGLSGAEHRLNGDDLLKAVSHADVVVDATDNIESRYQINDACLSARTPLVSGAAIRMEGQVAVFDPRESDSPCYRCLYDQGDSDNLNCADNGVLAPVVGIIGTIQAMEAIKIISGIGETLCGYVLYMDAKHMEWRRLKLPKNPRCLSCGSMR